MDKSTVNAIGRAITQLSFAQERAVRERDQISFAYITEAKDGLIALLAKDKPLVDVTPKHLKLEDVTFLSVCRLPEGY